MPTFKALYESPWHHPGAAWIAGALVVAAVAAVAARRPKLAALLLLLEIEILVDALFTGALSPIPPAATASTVLAIAFVILGDLRFFYLLERQRGPRRGRGRALAEAVGWSLLVPVLSAVPRAIWPSAFADSRWVFLVYELMFFGVALLALALTRRRHPPGPIRAWLTRLCAFELVQYGLWATADGIILSGAPGGDAGFALRLVPNVMYYAAFVPFVMLTAPEEARQ